METTSKKFVSHKIKTQRKLLRPSASVLATRRSDFVSPDPID
jgi:hypothetical protein